MSTAVDFGQRLEAAREAQRLSREDVADVLKLPPRIIQQLEQEQVDELPVAAFTVGYLRAYAKLLELDGDELVKAYRALTPAEEESNAVTGEMASLEPGYLPRSSVRWHDRIQANPGGVIATAVVIVALLIGLILWIVWPEQPGESPVTGPVDKVQPSLAVGIDSDSGVPAATESASTAAETRIEAPPNEEGKSEIQAEAGVQEPAPDTSEGNSPPRRISAVGEDRLVFSFREDCWVEVKDSSGKNLYSDLNRADTTLNLVGQAPFRVILGYAPGVELSFNGTAVALSAHTRNNVASVMLGQ